MVILNVAVAIYAPSSPETELVGHIEGTFATMFSPSQHLDIVLVTPETEVQVAKVCGPFFTLDASIDVDIYCRWDD